MSDEKNLTWHAELGWAHAPHAGAQQTAPVASLMPWAHVGSVRDRCGRIAC